MVKIVMHNFAPLREEIVDELCSVDVSPIPNHVVDEVMAGLKSIAFGDDVLLNLIDIMQTCESQKLRVPSRISKMVQKEIWAAFRAKGSDERGIAGPAASKANDFDHFMRFVAVDGVLKKHGLDRLPKKEGPGKPKDGPSISRTKILNEARTTVGILGQNKNLTNAHIERSYLLVCESKIRREIRFSPEHSRSIFIYDRILNNFGGN